VTQCQETLRTAMAIGADRAILVETAKDLDWLDGTHLALLREKCGFNESEFDAQWNAAQRPALKERVAEVFLQKARQQWCDLLEGSDVCFAPILSLDEAPQHPHKRARGTFSQVDGSTQSAPLQRSVKPQRMHAMRCAIRARTPLTYLLKLAIRRELTLSREHGRAGQNVVNNLTKHSKRHVGSSYDWLKSRLG